MAANVSIDDSALKKLLAALGQAAGDTTPAMASVGRAWQSKLQLGFRGSRDPFGNAWKPLKVRKGQPLRDTGALNRSFTKQVANNLVVLGTAMEYAPLHQFGFSGPVQVPAHVRKIRQAFGKPIAEKSVTVKAHTKTMNVPARPFLPTDGLPDSWKGSALRMLRNHLAKAIGQPGGEGY